MSKNKKPDLFDLFNDESLWGNQETDSLSHDEIMNPGWNKKLNKSMLTKLVNQNKERGTPCECIDPNGNTYTFDTIGDAAEAINPMFMNHPAKWFPLDGSTYIGQRGKCRKWKFRRLCQKD